jgi:type IV fimbrial biogenesis protein FimT
VIGVTMLELLVVICITAILSMLAFPSFQRFLQSTRINTATSLLHATLLYARSESLKRNMNVIVCRSDNADSPAPSCAPGSHSSGWGTGWIVYVDKDRNSTFSAGDEVIRTQSALFKSAEQGSILPNPHRNSITYRATGQTFGSYLQFSVNQASQRNDAGINRYLCIAAGGRARVDVRPCSR